MSQSVVVTGCGTGIGRAVFDRLIADGWAVVGLERDEKLAQDAAQAGSGQVDVLVGDAASRTELARAAARALELAPLGGWVNNAAMAVAGTLHDPVEAEVDALIRLNLMGYYWGASEAIRRFVDQRSPGAIVNISSIHGRSAFPGWAAYDTAKGGVNALTRYIAVEYGPVGIRANAIEPGAIRTPLMQRVIDAAADPVQSEYEMSALHPLRRVGEPREIAAVAAFLLSSEASFLTGECIAVDGGATARCYPYAQSPDLLKAYGLDS